MFFCFLGKSNILYEKLFQEKSFGKSNSVVEIDCFLNHNWSYNSYVNTVVSFSCGFRVRTFVELLMLD